MAFGGAGIFTSSATVKSWGYHSKQDIRIQQEYITYASFYYTFRGLKDHREVQDPG